MTNVIFPALAGLATGILSAWGIGGGSLLIIYMTVFAGVAQHAAQGVNLIYFIPTSLTALYSHMKNKLVEKKAAVPAIIAGTVTTLATSFAASAIDTNVMKKIFGVYIIIVGVMELSRKTKKTKKDC
jgi:uncharacterized membrane protein YfcA